jgi:hypothetical protein
MISTFAFRLSQILERLFVECTAAHGRGSQVLAGGLGLDAPKTALRESGPSHLGTGETADLNWQEEARGLAGSVPVNANLATQDSLSHFLLSIQSLTGRAGAKENPSPVTPTLLPFSM